jgi:hypothetical protein
MYELDTEAPAHDHWQDVAGHRLVRVHAGPRLGETLEVAGRIVAQHEPVECLKHPLASAAVRDRLPPAVATRRNPPSTNKASLLLTLISLA